MSHYIPLQTNNPECPVLLIDSQMPTAMLIDSALSRIKAGTDLWKASLRSRSRASTMGICIDLPTRRICCCEKVRTCWRW